MKSGIPAKLFTQSFGILSRAFNVLRRKMATIRIHLNNKLFGAPISLSLRSWSKFHFDNAMTCMVNDKGTVYYFA